MGEGLGGMVLWPPGEVAALLLPLDAFSFSTGARHAPCRTGQARPGAPRRGLADRFPLLVRLVGVLGHSGEGEAPSLSPGEVGLGPDRVATGRSLAYGAAEGGAENKNVAPGDRQALKSQGFLLSGGRQARRRGGTI
jgi:hypothetical protein